ncbi:MAG: NfeD family protein [Rhizobiales bacterium]|nr:NfeD family protein [Hyphomicrobiales bacterium]
MDYMNYVNFQDVFSEWGWFIAATILILLEVLAPGVFFLFFAFAAFIVAGVSWAVDIDWQYELLLFSAIGFLSMYGGKRYFKKEREKYNDHPINDPMAEFIGNKVSLETAIVNNIGKVQIKGVHWTVNGPDAEKDTIVKIVGKTDDRFIVELI